jgi:glycosyltransferase involved in cell wall biosynthesis
VGGNPAGLAAAERELGLESTAIVLEASPFGYPVDEVIWKGGEGRVTRDLKRWPLLARALRDYDVIHFNFGSTIMPARVPADVPGANSLPMRAARLRAALLEQLDLKLLARAGKAVFVTFQGDDARQGDVAARSPINVASEVPQGYYSPMSDSIKRRRIARFDRYAHGIYGLNPDLLHVLPERARFVPYAHVDTRTWQPSRPAGRNERPLVLHAPTHREVKGTRFVVDAVERLRAEGLSFDFELVEGLTQAEASKLYARADVVVDQLLAGWYGGLAIEAMALERPVVAYLRAEDLERFVPPEMRAEIPVIEAAPGTVYDVLKDLLTRRRDELSEIGRRGREYVRRWHDPLRIAKELVADYEAAVERIRSR